MKADRYTRIVSTFYERLKKTPEGITAVKPEGASWSLKEIVGHLIDSASNNHQRFVRLQEGNLPEFPGYDQLRWSAVQQHKSMVWMELVEFWYLFNRLLLHIIEHIDESSLGNTWHYMGKDYSLEFLIEDYFAHLQRHVEQFEGTVKLVAK